MPRSRSRSMASSACSSMSRISIVRVTSSNRSERVVLPWSMCAIMQKLRTLSATSSRCGAVMLVAGEGLRTNQEVVDHPKDRQQRHERQIDAPDRRNEPAQRHERRFDDHVHVAAPTAAQIRHPRQDGVHEHHNRVQPNHFVEYLKEIAPGKAHEACLLWKTGQYFRRYAVQV